MYRYHSISLPIATYARECARTCGQVASQRVSASLSTLPHRLGLGLALEVCGVRFRYESAAAEKEAPPRLQRKNRGHEFYVPSQQISHSLLLLLLVANVSIQEPLDKR